MKNIVIFYNHINREYKAYELLKMELEKTDNVRVHLFSIGFEYFKAIILMKTTKVDMVIFPGISCLKDYTQAMPFVVKNRKICIINMYTEQILSPTTKEAIFVPKDLMNCMIHFVWTEGMKEKLVNRGASEELIFVNGSIRSDLIKSSLTIRTKEDIAKEFGIDLNKVWVLFTEGRNGLKYSDAAAKFNLQNLCNITSEKIDEFLKVNIDSMNATLDEFEGMQDDFFEKYELIYRPHPSSNTEYHVNSRVKMIYKYSIYDWLKNVDINVVWNSTSAFEADMFGLPVLVCEHIKNPEENKAYGLERYKCISKVAEINEKLLDEAWALQNNKMIYEEFIGKSDGRCIERTCDAIMKVMNGGSENYKPLYRKQDKLLFYKKMGYDIVTMLMVKLKLFDIFKYPTSAYNVKADVPYIKENIMR